MGLLFLAVVILFVVFPVPMLLLGLCGFVLWLVVAIFSAFAEIVSGLFPEPRKADRMAWDNACQPMSLTITQAVFRLLCFCLLCLIACALSAAALAYGGPIAGGLVLLCVSAAMYAAYVKAVL